MLGSVLQLAGHLHAGVCPAASRSPACWGQLVGHVHAGVCPAATCMLGSVLQLVGHVHAGVCLATSAGSLLLLGVSFCVSFSWLLGSGEAVCVVFLFPLSQWWLCPAHY